jgi:FtsH-binding integral membrane protein
MTQSYNASEAFTATEAPRSDTGTLFGSTMALIAVTTGLFTLGAYLGRNLSGWGLAFWIASLVCLMAMNLTLRHSERLTLGMLFGFGLLVGLATAPTISYSPTSIQRRSGKPAARRRCLWPDSGLQAMRGEKTSPHSLGCSCGR